MLKERSRLGQCHRWALYGPIHQSTWKDHSRNFGLLRLSEVRSRDPAEDRPEAPGLVKYVPSDRCAIPAGALSWFPSPGRGVAHTSAPPGAPLIGSGSFGIPAFSRAAGRCAPRLVKDVPFGRGAVPSASGRVSPGKGKGPNPPRAPLSSTLRPGLGFVTSYLHTGPALCPGCHHIGPGVLRSS